MNAASFTGSVSHSAAEPKKKVFLSKVFALKMWVTEFSEMMLGAAVESEGLQTAER